MKASKKTGRSLTLVNSMMLSIIMFIIGARGVYPGKAPWYLATCNLLLYTIIVRVQNILES